MAMEIFQKMHNRKAVKFITGCAIGKSITIFNGENSRRQRFQVQRNKCFAIVSCTKIVFFCANLGSLKIADPCLHRTDIAGMRRRNFQPGGDCFSGFQKIIRRGGVQPSFGGGGFVGGCYSAFFQLHGVNMAESRRRGSCAENKKMRLCHIYLERMGIARPLIRQRKVPIVAGFRIPNIGSGGQFGTAEAYFLFAGGIGFGIKTNRISSRLQNNRMGGNLLCQTGHTMIRENAERSSAVKSFPRIYANRLFFPNRTTDNTAAGRWGAERGKSLFKRTVG